MSVSTVRPVGRIAAALLCTCLFIAAAPATAQEPVCIIPSPVSVERGEGSFVMTRSTPVIADGDAVSEGLKLIQALVPAMGSELPLAQASPVTEHAIRLQLKPSLKERLGEEGYELDVNTETVMLRAAGPAGLFYGTQTLLQLLPVEIFSRRKVEGMAWAIPCVRITDGPRFKWRGLLIDPARHFIPKQDVKEYIDVMALHKFNRLQIHLTDDQGWRIEIKKYPSLAEVGAGMDFTTIHQQDKTKTADGRRPGGYYTQDDIRELVRYAAQRHITIVPEIEMPAHTGAAMVAYPHLGLYPEKLENLPPIERWIANERVLAPRPRTVAFMQDVLAEVLDLFPSRYIHIGGDEANIGHWKQSVEMQALIRDMGLRDEAGLHSWFITQMDTFLAARGRQLVGWDEILQGGLAPGAVVMSWRGEAGGITAARAGHDVVMAPTSHTYFDYYQGKAETEPKAIGGFIPLEKVCEYEPIPAALNADQAKHVLGGQGQLWGEFISDQSHRMYMTYPRAAALAEVLWSPREGRGYASFLPRLDGHLRRLRMLDVDYRPLENQSVSRHVRIDPNACLAVSATHQLRQRGDRN